MPDRPLVLTGAAGALGGALVRRLGSTGHALVAIDVGEIAPSPDLALALSGVDLGDEQSVAKAFEQVRARFGGVAGLVNVAGGFAWETVADGSVETWDRMYRLNVRTALNACRAALPLLEEGGAIVNVGAAASARAVAGMGAYTAAKSGVARLTEALAEEYKHKGVRVNAILPSIIDTPANRADMPEADFADWVRPEEVANVIAFLLSPEASGVTGAMIPVTGRV